MSISEHVPATGPAGVLADVLATVRGLDGTLWSARSDDELVDTVGLVTRLTAALAAVEASAVAEVDARDLATSRLAYGSTGDWLTHLGGLRKGEGKRRVTRAKALTGPLTRTREALVAGTVSPGQADLIVAARRAAAGGLDPPPRRAVHRPPGRPPRLHRARPGGSAPGGGRRPGRGRPPAAGRVG